MNGAVIYAKDVVRLTRFYEAVAGIPVAHEEAGHAVLESRDFQLVIVAIPARIAGQIQIASPPVRREDTPIKPWLAVPSIAAARAAAAPHGGMVDGADSEWEFQGRRVCDGHDPEGNVFQLRAPVIAPGPGA